MPNAKELWMLVADTAHARLLHGVVTEHQRVHLEEVAGLKSTFAAGEHHRPSMLSGGRSGTPGHEREEKVAHFARELAKWLAHEIPGRGIGECLVAAPAHVLGALRKELPKTLAKNIQEHEAELAMLSAGQLATHQVVTSRLGVRPAR
jgi:protein required for attachment to host cells